MNYDFFYPNAKHLGGRKIRGRKILTSL